MKNIWNDPRSLFNGNHFSSTSISRVIVRGEAEFNFDCYAYNSSQIIRKCGRLPINRTAKIKTLKVRHNKMMFMISHSKI